MRVDKTVALVTGGASGLGQACVRMMVENGGKAVILDIDEARGNSVAEELGESVRFIKTDVSDEQQVQAAVDLARDAFGSVSAAISCAGIGTVGRTLGRKGPLPLELFERTIRVNLIGSFNVSRLASAAMAENEPNEEGERGVVIMTASVAAFDGQIGQVSYSASKGGIVGMTLPMARDFMKLGIRVMTIAPGLFDTPLLAGLPEAARISLAQQVPFPSRLGRPAEYASLAKQILENVMLNAEVIRLDGAIRMAPR